MKDKMVDKVEQLWGQFSTLAEENNIDKEIILSKFDSFGSSNTKQKLAQSGTSLCSDMFMTMFTLPFNVLEKVREDSAGN